MKWHHDKKGGRHIYPCRTIAEALNALRNRIDVSGDIRQVGKDLLDDSGKIARLIVGPRKYAVVIQEKE